MELKRKAVLIGATGLVGSHLLKLLLEHEHYEQVNVYTRQSTGVAHHKLTEEVGDLLDDDLWGDALIADDIFCAIGTTQSKTPDLAVYRNIDFGIPVRAATLGLKGGVKRFLVISSMGANASSKIFYPRIKGQMEMALQKLPLQRLRILRPSLLAGRRSEFRLGERVGQTLLALGGTWVPSRLRPISAQGVARAMLTLALDDSRGGVIFESDQIQDLALPAQPSKAPSPNKA